MPTPEYHAYLRKPEWSLMSARIRKRDGGKCLACASSRRLNCHHGTYRRLGREDDDDLFTLCDYCHHELHRRFERHKKRKGIRHVSLLTFTKAFIKDGRHIADPKPAAKIKVVPAAPRFDPDSLSGFLARMASEKKVAKPEPVPKTKVLTAHEFKIVAAKRRMEERKAARRARRLKSTT